MARLQILELPEGTDDERPPYILVVDQADEATANALSPSSEGLSPYSAVMQKLTGQSAAEQIGARGILVFADTIDIPANDTTAYLGGGEARNEVTVKLGDQDVRSAIAADMNKARQQAGLPTVGQRLADERTDIARDMDRLAKWKNELLDALGMDRTRDWDDIRNAARGMRKKTEDLAAKIERVLRLPETPQQGVGAEAFDYLNGYRDATRAALSVLVNPADDQSPSDA